MRANSVGKNGMGGYDHGAVRRQGKSLEAAVDDRRAFLGQHKRCAVVQAKGTTEFSEGSQELKEEDNIPPVDSRTDCDLLKLEVLGDKSDVRFDLSAERAQKVCGHGFLKVACWL